MTRRQAMAVGTRLALGHGVSDGMALLKARHAALRIATASDAATAAMLRRLGKALSTLLPAAAAAPMRATFIPAMYAVEPEPFVIPKSNLLDAATRRLVTPKVPIKPVTPDRVSVSPTRMEGRASPAVNRAARPNGDTRQALRVATVRTIGGSREPQQQGPLAGEGMHKAGMIHLNPRSQDPPIALQRPIDVSSPEPAANVSLPTITAATPPFSPAFSLPSPRLELQHPNLVPDIIQMKSSTPVPMLSITHLGRAADHRQHSTTEPPFISEGSLEHISAAPVDTPNSQDINPVSRATFEPTLRSYRRPNALTQNATSPVQADIRSPSVQTDQEPRQGTIVLDGAELGRWVISYLESQALRPGTMTTAIDPRMTATFPGAPTGA